MQNQKKDDGQAIPFIILKQSNNNGNIRYEFQLQQKAIQLFDSIKNHKIAIATVAGPQRSGKSFLSNRLLKRMSGFAIGPSTMPCTKGLWIWAKPIPINSDTVLIIVDTQGLNSVQRNINVDLKIFSLSILLSSVFIYNSLGHIDQKAIENMSYVLKISENIRVKHTDESQGDIAKMFPYFYWVLRDFSLDLNNMTQNLKDVSNDEKDPKNQIRSKIRKLFTQRRCECFPRPINEEDRLAYIENLSYDELRPKFRQKLDCFVQKFYQTLPVKTIGGKSITGNIYLNLISEYIGAINSGKVPQVMNSLERVISSDAKVIVQSMITKYKQSMNKVVEGDQIVDDGVIEDNHKQFMRRIEDKFDEKFKKWSNIVDTENYKNKMFDTIEKDFKQRMKKNCKLSELQCTTQFNKFTRDFSLPDLKGIQALTQSLVSQKLFQFKTKIKQYLSRCKAPIKYLFFIEKVPKFIFQYFDQFISRVKGIYGIQVQNLMVEVRAYERQKKIMQQQQNLITQLQKQIEIVQHEKQSYRKQYEKGQKLKQFEQETEKMSKKEIKKNLQSYKEQILDLQQNNEQLSENIAKLRQQLISKRSEISTMVKKPTNNFQMETNTPSELFQNIAQLKNKINNMNNYYEKKIPQICLNSDIQSEIDQIRSEKYSALEKKNEQVRQNREQLRKHISKMKQQYEKKLQLLNEHADYLRDQNMKLEQKLKNLPNSQQKIKNIMMQKKKIEECLRLKQNNINSLTILNQQKDKHIDKIQEDYGKVEANLAIMKGQKANFESYKESFTFLLRQSLNWVLNKNNKLKHSVKALQPEDLTIVKKIFKELNLNPF